MNLAIFDKKDGSLVRLLINAVQHDNHFQGDNGSITLKSNKFDFVWTNDSKVTPIYGEKEKADGTTCQILIGYKETIKDFTPLIPPSHLIRNNLGRNEKILLWEKIEELAEMSSTELDQYVDNAIDLVSIKALLKKNFQVLIALIKILRSKLD